MPTQPTLAQVDAFWAGRLGCAHADLHRPGITLLVNAGDFTTYRGAFLLRWGDACVFTVPAALRQSLQGTIGDRTLDDVFDDGFLARAFGAHCERIIGPAFQGCADASDFRPVAGRGTRLLTSEDDEALAALELACDPEEWEHAAIADGRSPLFGCFAGDELVAAGTLIAWGEHLRNLGIVTHPAYRGRGYGRAVVSALTAHALAQGHVAQYQTLLSNAGSLAIARALGFHQYATTLAVRLRAIA